jgi:hypothetical protein
MSNGPEERIIGIMAGANLAAIMLFSRPGELTLAQLQTRATDDNHTPGI